MRYRNQGPLSESSQPYIIELEPEVREWLETLSGADYRAAERFADRLAVQGPLLPFPLSSHLGDGLRELRIGPTRVTYWIAPGRRAALLTVFRKTKMRETDQVMRAQRARKLCEAEHPPAGPHDALTDPTLELIEQLAAALGAGARIEPGSTPEFVFEARAA